VLISYTENITAGSKIMKRRMIPIFLVVVFNVIAENLQCQFSELKLLLEGKI
jgi:hypothetical protein